MSPSTERHENPREESHSPVISEHEEPCGFFVSFFIIKWRILRIINWRILVYKTYCIAALNQYNQRIELARIWTIKNWNETLWYTLIKITHEHNFPPGVPKHASPFVESHSRSTSEQGCPSDFLFSFFFNFKINFKKKAMLKKLKKFILVHCGFGSLTSKNWLSPPLHL